jgi:hypothetical protein
MDRAKETNMKTYQITFFDAVKITVEADNRVKAMERAREIRGSEAELRVSVVKEQ